MDSLNVRKVRILQAIVNDYVLTTKPVGSERLIEVYHIGCKSATVRNEMAEMAEMGYLIQPHTSAGRIPTDRGYRYYVDVLMDPPKALHDAEVQQAQAGAHQGASEIEEIIAQTCSRCHSINGKEQALVLLGNGLTHLPELPSDLLCVPGFALQEAIEVGEVASEQMGEDDFGDPEPALVNRDWKGWRRTSHSGDGFKGFTRDFSFGVK